MAVVRAIYRAVIVDGYAPPGNVAHLKIYYPAAYTDSPEERDTGLVPADSGLAPCPAVIVSPGINLAPDGAAWLAQRLAADGRVVVLYSLIREEMPGQVNLTPGLDTAAFRPENTGTRPSCAAYAPIIEALRKENETGVLQGLIDLSKLVFGGHSAGGSMALLNANPAWFENVRAVFSYGAHTAAAAAFGAPPGTVQAICPDVPVMLLGGTRDGCIAGSAGRYGDEPGDPTGRVIQTFDEAITRDKGDCILGLVEGGNHFTFATPVDGTTGRPFIDYDEACDGEAARQLMGNLVAAFIAANVEGDRAAGERIEQLLDDPMFSVVRRK